MAIDKDSIRVALMRVPYPDPAYGGADLVAAGAVSKVAYCDGYASIRIAGANLHADRRAGLVQQVGAAVRLHAQQAAEELADVHVEITDDEPAVTAGSGAGLSAAGVPPASQRGEPITSGSEHRPLRGGPEARPTRAAGSGQGLPNVRHIVAVGAGKGGVGKSTVAVNLAVGLARRGHAVGLMDGDIYGPSLPTMLGLGGLDPVVRGSMIQPFLVHGVKAVTIGKLVEPDKPLIWRGPMAHGAFKQLVEQTEWGELDYLIIDLPPGTGDVALTMAQLLKLTGAVVVCTPQKVAQDDATRATRMFQQLGVEVLGVVENMSSFVADDLDPPREYDIFGKGGAQVMAQRLGVPFLGAVPITVALGQNSDSGDASANFAGDARNSVLKGHLEALVTNLEGQVALAGMRQGATRPTLSIS